MTVTARRGRRHMSRCILAARERPVVTHRAGRRGLRVIERQYLDPLGRRFVVACLTLVARAQSTQMLPGLAAGRNTVVAIHASADKCAVVDGGPDPTDCRVARPAIQHRWNVRGTFTAGQHTVMALGAHRRGCLRVIESKNATPSGRGLCMAGIAIVRRRQALQVFTGFRTHTCERTVVTAHAIACERSVFHGCRPPCGLHVACRTLRGGRNMCRQVLARRQRSVVTAIAGRDRCLRMIKPQDGRPRRRSFGMTCVAVIGGGQTLQVLPCFGTHSRKRTVVAANAIAGETRVIDCRRPPCGLHVAGRTLCRSWNVSGDVLASRENVVVAGIASHDRRLRVIERNNGDPFSRRFRVACVAVVTRTQTLAVLAALSADVREGSAVATDAVTAEAGVIDGCRSPSGLRMTG